MPEISISHSPRPCPNRARSLVLFAKSRIGPALQRLFTYLKRTPPKMRIWGAVGVALLFSFVSYAVFSSSPAKLRVVCQHSFRSAELAVWVDKDLSCRGTLSGAAKRKFGVFKSIEGSFSKTVGVPSGRHSVQVRVAAPEEGFDQTRTIFADFSGNQETVLAINCRRHDLLSVTTRGSASVPVEASENPLQKYATSILLSILGSAMSAAIGLLVQDFLKGQKQRLTKSESVSAD